MRRPADLVNPALTRASIWYRRVLSAFGLAAGVVVATLALLVSLDVLLRNLGIVNFPWLIEVAEYAVYVSTLLAAPWVLSEGAHVRVDVLVAQLPRVLARAIDAAMNLVGASVCAVFAYYGALTAHDSFTLDAMLFKELVVPEWWLLAVVPVSGTLLTVEFIVRIVRAGDATHEPIQQGL